MPMGCITSFMPIHLMLNASFVSTLRYLSSLLALMYSEHVCVLSQYVYADLASLVPSAASVNVYGFVKYMTEPTKTKGTGNCHYHLLLLSSMMRFHN